MKKCFKCKELKPLNCYYRHKQMADGHLNKCKECTKKDANKHREDNIEKVRAYDRKRGSLQHRIDKVKEYDKTENGKKKKLEGSSRYRKRNEIKYKAHCAVNNALRDGKLIRPSNCSVCFLSEKLHGHHDDYTKPLAVRWLCDKCHKAWHKLNKPIAEIHEEVKAA